MSLWRWTPAPGEMFAAHSQQGSTQKAEFPGMCHEKAMGNLQNGGKKSKEMGKSGKKGHKTGAKPGFGLRNFVPGAPAQQPLCRWEQCRIFFLLRAM